jgi:hypothetical protein
MALMQTRVIVILLLLSAALAGPLESVRDADRHTPGDPIESCDGTFSLAVQGPCDTEGPCRNPSHDHHGHRHDGGQAAVPCGRSHPPRPQAAAVLADVHSPSDLAAHRFQLDPAARAPKGFCPLRPAGRSPPASLLG